MLQTAIFLGFVFVMNSGINGKRTKVLKDCNVVLAKGKSRQCNPLSPYPKVGYEGGNINLIFAVPHDGALKPVNIKDRRDGCKLRGKCRYGDKYLKQKNCIKNSACKIANVADAFTQEIAKLARQEFFKLTKKQPFLVINNLYRAKMDPNRPKEEACQGNMQAKKAFEEYHNKIKAAKRRFKNQPGLLIDIHGQKHPSQMTEIGYRVTKNELRKGFRNAAPSELSIRSLVSRKKARIGDYLFGPNSLGKKFNDKSYAAMPSPENKAPRRVDEYYKGGYSIYLHGSNKTGKVDAIQLEFPSNLRTNPKKRKELSEDLAKILMEFYDKNYNCKRSGVKGCKAKKQLN